MLPKEYRAFAEEHLPRMYRNFVDAIIAANGKTGYAYSMLVESDVPLQRKMFDKLLDDQFIKATLSSIE
jgi:hypothetical protein